MDADGVDVVLVVCPRCRAHGGSGVIGRVVRGQRDRHRFVTVVADGPAGDEPFEDGQLLRSAEFVVFDFGVVTGGVRDSLDVECRHGRRSVSRVRLEREIASHRRGKPARVLMSEPPAH
jgi:hypothetical protein